MPEAEDALKFWQEVEMAEEYFLSPQAQMFIIENAIRDLNMPKTSTIYEFGCGMGRNLNHLKTVFPDMTFIGIDCNKRSIEIAKEHFSNIEFRLGSLEHLRPSGVIFTVSVLSHVPDPIKYLNQFMENTDNIILLELRLPKFGKVNDPNIINYSYSHDYEYLLESWIRPALKYKHESVSLAKHNFLDKCELWTIQC